MALGYIATLRLRSFCFFPFWWLCEELLLLLGPGLRSVGRESSAPPLPCLLALPFLVPLVSRWRSRPSGVL